MDGNVWVVSLQVYMFGCVSLQVYMFVCVSLQVYTFGAQYWMTGFASMLGAILSALVYVRVLYPLRMISVNQVSIGGSKGAIYFSLFNAFVGKIDQNNRVVEFELVLPWETLDPLLARIGKSIN